ncbi:IPT/TIG domain-containing protein [Patescibacteria group bacterium]|nr:IPT/TIG domain-containing protein [Patescibacteria group bacterium]
MKKTSFFAVFFASALLVGSLPFAPAAHAQVYGNPAYPTTGYTSGSCLTLTAPLTIGTSDFLSGGQVSQLQSFLARSGYLPSTLVTGYFGTITAGAVAQFQASHGIPPTSVVGPLTRAAVQQVSCGGGNTYPVIPPVIPPAYPTYPPYNGGNTYSYLSLSSLSATSGSAGMSVTLYGTGFDSWNNVVHFGSTAINSISSNGTSLTFIVPSLSTGNYPISVSNSRGTTNALQFNLTNSWFNCPLYGTTYGNTNQCGCNYQYNGYNYNGSNLCYPNQQTIILNSLTSNFVNGATMVTAYGSGFSSNGNTVRFGNSVISNVYSSNGTSLTFTVPYNLTNTNSYSTSYPVSITNSYGATSNTVQFVLTNNGNQNGTVSITSVNGPTNVTTGTTNTYVVYLTDTVNEQVTVTANWQDQSGNSTSQQAFISNNGSVSLSHTYQNSGTYTIQFTARGNSGSYTSYNLTVVVSGSNNGGGSSNISYLSPQQGSVGTTIAIQGSGFATYGNTVHFGIGGMRNLQSYNNGTVIYYTIPRAVSGCDLWTSTFSCTQPVVEVTPRAYLIYVTGPNGQASNTRSFQVN